MSRFTNCFNKKTALIPFITAGDPNPKLTVPLMHTLVEAGADLIELGIPFSDPMADGPVIQRASERALAAGTNLTKVLAMVKQFRIDNQTTPVVLMGYLNPIEIMGYKKFAKAAQDAQVDGILTVDLPPEEATEFTNILRHYKIAPIFLIAPTTTTERIKKIVSQAEGYLYYVSLKGVTGSANLDLNSVAEKLTEIKKYSNLPIGVGFGIKDAKTAAQVATISDAVIVGSALVQLIENTSEDKILEVVSAFIREFNE